MKSLLDNGISINAQSDAGWTAAMCAADRDNLEIFLTLELRGADMFLKDAEEDTVFMKALDAALEGKDQIMQTIRQRALKRQNRDGDGGPEAEVGGYADMGL